MLFMSPHVSNNMLIWGIMESMENWKHSLFQVDDEKIKKDEEEGKEKEKVEEKEKG